MYITCEKISHFLLKKKKNKAFCHVLTGYSKKSLKLTMKKDLKRLARAGQSGEDMKVKDV